MSKPMSINIEMFPAKAGDSFLVHIAQKYILIDCGFTETYRDFIKTRLQTLNQQGEELALLVITHIDEDHIQGALKLLEENVNADEHQIIPIRQIWHNTLRHIPIIREKSKLIDKEFKKLERATKEPTITSPIGPVSAKQGLTLGKDILKGCYAWNSDFNGKAVSTNQKIEVEFTPSVKITLLSPSEDKLSKLFEFWQRKLYKLGLPTTITEEGIFDDAFEYLLKEMPDFISPVGKKISKSKLNIDELKESEFKKDISVPNGSSIAFVIEFNGKRLLFLADAHAPMIEEGLEQAFPNEPLPIHFDFIKVAHHGSFANNKPSLWDKIDSLIYAISTDGEDHEHPSLATLAWIVGRPTVCPRHLYFNYPNASALLFDDAVLKSKFKYETHITHGNHSTVITISNSCKTN